MINRITTIIRLVMIIILQAICRPVQRSCRIIRQGDNYKAVQGFLRIVLLHTYTRRLQVNVYHSGAYTARLDCIMIFIVVYTIQLILRGRRHRASHITACGPPLCHGWHDTLFVLAGQDTVYCNRQRQLHLLDNC
jgi:hypothetical protein